MEENVFERMAKKYDSPERMALAKIISDRVRLELKETKEKTLLDYGSGTGLVGLALTDLVKQSTLVDSSENMVQIIQEKIDTQDIRHVTAKVLDLTKETLTEKVDIIIVSLVLLHIPDTKKILKKLYHSLNEGGRLILIDFDKNEHVSHPKVHNGFLASDLSELLAQVGFSNSKIENFHHGKNVFMKQDADLFIAISNK
jgi:ubiquinone/menaquinone biosynthesis C-methylase UbiE